jgi:multidrug efflux pump
VLTLFTTPVVYLFFDRLGRRWSAAPQPRLVTEDAPA